MLYLHDTVKNEETTKSNSLSLDSEDRFLWSKVSVTNDVIDTICKGGKLLEQRGSVSKRKALLGFEDELIAIQLCAAKVTELKVGLVVIYPFVVILHLCHVHPLQSQGVSSM